MTEPNLKVSDPARLSQGRDVIAITSRDPDCQGDARCGGRSERLTEVVASTCYGIACGIQTQASPWYLEQPEL